jgi:hypothetical protein
MRASTILRGLAGFAVAGVVSASAVIAQNPSHAHIGHVADGFRSTPDGQGLLPAGVAEAQVAAQHAGFAARDPNNLDGMKRHMGHVIHALDPSQVESGPGAGFGVKAAAAGVVRHIELAAGSDGASDNVKTHANHVATAARNVERWADEAIALANEVLDATDNSAADLVAEIEELTDAILNGRDANGDGRVGWQEGEGGLEQATFHVNAMKRGEGLGG